MLNSPVNAAPTAVAGDEETLNFVVGETAALDGTGSSDPDGDALTYSWTILSSPDGSVAALSDNTLSAPSFSADVEGTYTVELIVNDGTVDSLADVVEVDVFRPIVGLDYQVIDAEYNLLNDTIVMVSENPSRLNIYDPVLDVNTSIDLPLVPTSVSIGPDGLFAAVGHNGSVSYVDLGLATLVNIPVSTDVVDIVLAGNDYIYAFPRVDQSERIRSVDIATEEEFLHTGNLIYAGTLAKLHPSGNYIYGADNGLSPSDIEKYDLAAGNADYLYDSPYHGDFNMCGDLWISKDGERIFTRCGNFFRSAETEMDDMIYNGSLSDAPGIRDLDDSVLASEVALIADGAFSNDSDLDIEIYKYDYDFMQYKEDFTLSSFVESQFAYQAHGRFIFYHSAGDQLFVVVQADEESGFLQDYGVVTYSVVID